MSDPYSEGSGKPADISDEAYEWFTVLSSGNVREEDFQEYLAWAERHPEQARQVDGLERLWARMGTFSVPKPPSLEDAHEAGASRTTRFGFRVRRYAVSLSAGAAMAALIVIFLGFQDRFDRWEIYATDRAESTIINLTDGSSAHLNVLSHISVRFTDEERRVVLDEGEASFTVAADSSRPFIVAVGDSEVRALGTEFNVKIEHDQTVAVTLVEGTIQVAKVSEAATEFRNTLDEPGQQAKILLAESRSSLNDSSATTGAIEVSRTVLATELAWREGKIIFEGQTLKEAINEINRYSRHQIDLIDSASADMPVYGVFNSGDWEGFVSAVERGYALTRYDIRSGTTELRGEN